jgi:hypothetical protein
VNLPPDADKGFHNLPAAYYQMYISWLHNQAKQDSWNYPLDAYKGCQDVYFSS